MSSLPGDLTDSLRRRLPGAGEDGSALGDFRPVSGGCIHRAGVLDTKGGPVFLKWNQGEAATGFTSEARALSTLRDAAGDEGLLDVPRVLDAWDAAGEDEPGWLVLEYLPPSPAEEDHGERLGRGLARLHGHSAPRFGWPETNRIGPLPQENPARERWAEFWVDARLLPQLRAARDTGALGPDDVRLVERVVQLADVALEPLAADPPALIHGDLWSGNVHPGPRGRPVLVDPAACYGHGEVDLAMARLFGGFPEETFEAYQDETPLADGFDEVRLPLYQLFYLLVHVRLFGAGYRS
ncbi:MAG: fructosamine kinase family protein, partial [Gemmatimonadota bacterium]